MIPTVTFGVIASTYNNSAVISITAVKLDATRIPSGYTLSNNDLTIENTSGGSDYRQWVPAIKPIDASFNGIVYWEVKIEATQTANLNGYTSIFPYNKIDDSSIGYYVGENPINEAAIGYRGIGELWSNSTREITSVDSYADGDILMFAFSPSQNALWVGKNGIWHRDPDTEAASFTSSISAPQYVPVLHGRSTGDRPTLFSLESQFFYTVPAVATPYANELTNFVTLMNASSVDVYFELGGNTGVTSTVIETWYEFLL